jgi:hypothetical protein
MDAAHSPRSLPFGLAHQLPPRFRRAFVRTACQRIRWQGPIPSLGQIGQGLEQPRRPERRSAEATAWYWHGHPRFTDEAGGFKFGAALAHDAASYEAAERKHRAALDAWRQYRDLAAEALRYLAEITPPPGVLTDTGIRLADGDEDELTALAQERADLYRSQGPGDDPDQRRRRDPAWWRRQLRREAADARTYLAAALRLVGSRGSRYVDAHSLKCWQRRQERADEWAARRALVNVATGQTIGMADVMQASREAAVARVYGMMCAIGDRARQRGWTPLFLTLTLPGSWHPSPSIGGRTWTPEHHPAAADKELQHRWARFRALLHKQGIDPEGFWSREPHSDGCPHQHAVLWIDPAQADAVRQTVAAVYPGVHGGRVVVIDETRARAETYVMFYILKSLNSTDQAKRHAAGAINDNGTADGDHLAEHAAVRAWASERRLRRYAFVGPHGSQRTWQLLATWDAPPEGAPARLRAAWEAMQVQDGARVLDLLDGTAEVEGEAPCEEPGLRLMYEHRESRYGELVRRPRAVLDVAAGYAVLLTVGKWEQIDADDPAVTLADNLPRAGAANGAARGRAPPSAGADPPAWGRLDPGERRRRRNERRRREAEHHDLVRTVTRLRGYDPETGEVAA